MRLSLLSHATAVNWTWVTLPPAPWRWRQRLAMRQLTDMARANGLLEQPWDCILCTSLMAVGEVRGLLPRHLRDVPVVMLVHEHQAAYPAGLAGPEPRDAQAITTDLMGMLAADLVLFTSQWNRRSCLAGMRSLLGKAPGDGLSGWLERLQARSEVWWPPVEDPLGFLEHRSTARPVHNPDNYGPNEPQLVAWPHRHQQDKGPKALLALAKRYSEAWDLNWALLGERRGPPPAPLQQLREHLGSRLVHDGWCEARSDYLDWLKRANWVCSTARHEYFGIAVVEALLSGALPWLPRRLSYPELVPEAASGLHPGMHLESKERAHLMRAIRSHLAPAIADASTRHLENRLLQLIS
ncbi:MAG: DUF3524 domain-containing protein [Phycisphaerales bacterium]|nr:DUF3524 domain-containing protein [Phycisphaerales bacterium]